MREKGKRNFFKVQGFFHLMKNIKKQEKAKHKGFFYMKGCGCFATFPFFTKMKNEIKAI